MAGAGASAVLLQLEQFDLETPFQVLVLLAGHPVVVGISLTPGVDVLPVPVKQHRVVIITVVDGVPMLGRRQGFQVYLGHDPTLSQLRNRWPLT